jgi:hypothetical protein
MTPAEKSTVRHHLRLLLEGPLVHAKVQRDLLTHLVENTIDAKFESLGRDAIFKQVWQRSRNDGVKTLKVNIRLVNRVLKEFYGSEKGRTHKVWISARSHGHAGVTPTVYEAHFDFDPKPQSIATTSEHLLEQRTAIEKRVIELNAPPEYQMMAQMMLEALIKAAPVGSHVSVIEGARTNSVFLYFRTSPAVLERLTLLADVGWLDDLFGYPVEALHVAHEHDARLHEVQSSILSSFFTPLLRISPNQESVEVSFAVFSSIGPLDEPLQVRVSVYVTRDAPGETPDVHDEIIELRSSTSHRISLASGVGSPRVVQLRVAGHEGRTPFSRRLMGMLRPASRRRKHNPPLYVTFFPISSMPILFEFRVEIEGITASSAPGRQTSETKAAELRELIPPPVEPRRPSFRERTAEAIKRFFDDLFRGGGGFSGGGGPHTSGKSTGTGKSTNGGRGGPAVIGRCFLPLDVVALPVFFLACSHAAALYFADSH